MLETEQVTLRSLAEKLREQYRKVTEKVRILETRDSAAASAVDLDQINAVLTEATQTTSAMASIRESLQSKGESVPEATREITDATAKLAMQLIPKITELEKSAQDARARLAPQIHEGVRALQMQNAYNRGT